jgi:hypothetical protein
MDGDTGEVLHQPETSTDNSASVGRDHGQFRLETDTSDITMGTVLSQKQEDGSCRPLGYSSKSYSSAEANYMTYNKELLAIM